MASNTVDNNNIPDIETNATDVTNTTNVTLEEKINNVTPEEQDNINNMNAKSLHNGDTNTIPTNTDSNINNNITNELNNTANNKATQEIPNNVNHSPSNGENNINTVHSTTTSDATSIQESSLVETVSMQDNALSDLMNTYSSDEDMFENFRSKPDQFDNHKSEDEECLSSSTSFLSINESGNSSEEEPIACAPKKSKGVKMKSTRNKGELDLDDLPPIEDLQISVPEEQCLPVGKILNIVDTLVLVKTLKNTPTLDLDSILFLDKGQRSLGKIFDVIGPVTGPVYCVRFNSHQHIVDSNIKVDQDVYCAPQTEHTSYVPLPNLINMKGTDASWESDREPPPEVVEFSDDEEERRVKREVLRDRRNNRNNAPHPSQRDPDAEPPSPKTRRPTPFEQRMNLRNLLMTASYERRGRQEPSLPPPPPATLIRAPTLPDIPPLPLPQPGPRFSAPPPHHPPAGHSLPNTRLPPPPLGVFSPPPPLFHQTNKKQRPSTASPFSHPHRFPPTPPMFSTPPFPSLPPPPPLFNDMLLFSPQGGHPYPYVTTPPPFQFGMPPLIGRGAPLPPPRYRHAAPRPPTMMRPAFGSRHRF